LRLIELALLSGFVVAITLAAVTALLQAPLCRLLDAQAPASRARIAAGILLAPMLVGIAYALSTLLVASYGVSSPSISAVCSSHHGSWLHACLGHPIALDSTSWLWMAFVALLLICTGLMLQLGSALLRAKRHLGALVRMGRRHKHHHQLHVLDTDAPLAVACDVGAGHVLLARWLIEALRPEQLQVVLAHERAHLAHRDVRWRLLARIASALHFPAPRRRLLETLALACEQRCDQVAAEHVGSRLVVAETLIAVERLYRRRQPMPPSLLSTAFGTEFLRQRVEALLVLRRKQAWPLGPVLAATTLTLVLASAGWIHNLSEFLVTVLMT
jgi:beta-lactamase regulating signal transducer with metallopeptidase domain